MSILTSVKKVFGSTEDPEQKWRPDALPSQRLRRIWRGWRRPSFKRRVALGPLVKVRERRAEFIRNSQLDAVAIAAERREAQVKDRREGGHLHMAEFRRRQKPY